MSESQNPIPVLVYPPRTRPKSYIYRKLGFTSCLIAASLKLSRPGAGPTSKPNLSSPTSGASKNMETPRAPCLNPHKIS